MENNYPKYKYSTDDVKNNLARFVRLDNPEGYPFDNFHTHEYNEIMMFIKGGGHHNINFQSYLIEDNSIHLLAANDLHWVERAMTSEGFALEYKEQFLHKLQIANPNFDFSTIFNVSRVINLSEEEAFDFKFIKEELLRNKTNTPYTLQVIGTFLAKIASLNHDGTPAKKISDPIVSEVTHLIELHFKTLLNLKDYAEMLNLTPKTLNNRFKKSSSTTVTELILQRRIKESKKMLCSNEFSISEIALELGFKEVAHFSNWFFKNVACYPLEYKYEND